MRRLWAPWRQEYLESEDKSCIFCTIPRKSSSEDRKNLLLLRGKVSFILLNKYPYNSGHLMVSPYRHITELSSMDRDEILEVADLLKLSCQLLKDEFSPDGFNIGANIGHASGAGYEHLHFHVVPRWNGDTNFMPIVADTKVLPEHLEVTYERLSRALNATLKKESSP